MQTHCLAQRLLDCSLQGYSLRSVPQLPSDHGFVPAEWTGHFGALLSTRFVWSSEPQSTAQLTRGYRPATTHFFVVSYLHNGMSPCQLQEGCHCQGMTSFESATPHATTDLSGAWSPGPPVEPPLHAPRTADGTEGRSDLSHEETPTPDGAAEPLAREREDHDFSDLGTSPAVDETQADDGRGRDATAGWSGVPGVAYWGIPIVPVMPSGGVLGGAGNPEASGGGVSPVGTWPGSFALVPVGPGGAMGAPSRGQAVTRLSQREAPRWLILLLVGLVVLLVAGGVLLGVKYADTPAPSSFVLPRNAVSAPPAGPPADAAAIAKKVDPAMVDIYVASGYDGAQAAGSGMVLTPTGLVLTNNHVVEGATELNVVDLGNNETYSGKVLGYSRTQDLAVVQLNGAHGLPTIGIGNSSSLEVGSQVIAMGNAGGLGGTPQVVSGVVEALSVSITANDQATGVPEKLTDMIESSAPIVPGDSGGPLLDAQGKVVGVDTAGSNGPRGVLSAGAQAYSIPIDRALSVVAQIRSGKAASTVHVGGTAFLGVQVTKPATGAGAYVVGTIGGSPVVGVGIQQGDLLTSLGGKPITTPQDLAGLLQAYAPGQSVTIGWTDASGQSRTATLTLASGPPQ